MVSGHTNMSDDKFEKEVARLMKQPEAVLHNFIDNAGINQLGLLEAKTALLRLDADRRDRENKRTEDRHNESLRQTRFWGITTLATVIIGMLATVVIGVLQLKNQANTGVLPAIDSTERNSPSSTPAVSHVVQDAQSSHGRDSPPPQPLPVSPPKATSPEPQPPPAKTE